MGAVEWAAIIGGPGGLVGIYSLIKYRMRMKLIRHALDTKGTDGVDAVARATQPTTEAAKAWAARDRSVERKAATPRVIEAPPSDEGTA